MKLFSSVSFFFLALQNKLTSFLSPTPHPFHLALLSLHSVSECEPHPHTRLFVFPSGRTTVPGESIYWQDKESGWCEITRPHSTQLNLEVKRRAGVSNKVPPHSLYMQLHWKSPSATPSLLPSLTVFFSPFLQAFLFFTYSLSFHFVPPFFNLRQSIP